MVPVEPVIADRSSRGESTLAEEMAEVAAVLASKIFSRAHNLSAILNYVCQEHANGRGDAIKEYNVAVGALGRRAEFDPSSDSVVRVEASKLRKRLLEFYATEGASHNIRIELPAVGYAPRFVRRDRLGEDAEVTPEDTTQLNDEIKAAPRPSRSSRRPWLIIGLAFTVVVATAAAGYIAKSRTERVSLAATETRTSPDLLGAIGGNEPLRIAAGSVIARYIDRSGQVWLGDRYFTGGSPILKPDHRILRTLDPTLYQTAREGDFQYDIPLKPGTYDLHLHFAEIVHREALGSGLDGQRRFRVILNGKILLNNFDIALDAPGADTADERVFNDVSPGRDGFLHLQFMTEAVLSGIEVLPSSPGRMLPVRILSAPRALFDTTDQFWSADRYFFGGTSRVTQVVTAQGTKDPNIFSSLRFGNFWYFIPVADGLYSVTLRFVESNFGVDNIGSPTYAPGGAGSRVFNVLCNGICLARNLDVYKEAGGAGRALVKTFHGLRPNAQGKLVLQFESVVDYPILSAIEVLDESR